MTDPLFNTAGDALRFAFHFSHQQYDRPLVNRMADKSRGAGLGLSGLDGAGQAGMIRKRLAELPNLQRAILIARHAPRTFPCACGRACCAGEAVNFEWREAIRLISEHACVDIPGGAGKFRLRYELVRRYFGVPDTLTAIAERCAVRQQAASDHYSRVVSWLRGTRGKADKPGIVGQEAEAMAAAGDVLRSAMVAVEG